MRIAALYVHPLKACRALAVDEAAVSTLGLEHDRRHVFVGEDGVALTQRVQPLLATIRPNVGRDGLRLDLGGLAQLELSPSAFKQPITVDVWGKRIPGRAASQRETAAVADYLGVNLKLVMLDQTAQSSFADSRPVLVTATGMLAELKLDIGMERFRPNIVVEGAGDWATLEGNDVLLEREKPCGRCEVTTIDQTSGTRRGPEPLVTLNERFAGNFGVYYRVTRPGRLRRGEDLRAG
jgi:uncharacterized protein YcbX